MEMLKALHIEKESERMVWNYNAEDAGGIVWPKGQYEARIDNIKEDRSKAGNDMLVLEWRVFSGDGREMTVTDYIVKPKGLWKYGAIASAIGKSDRFKANKLQPRELLDAIALVSVDIEEPKDAKYGPKNVIKAYDALAKLTVTPQTVAEREPGDEDDWLSGD